MQHGAARKQTDDRQAKATAREADAREVWPTAVGEAQPTAGGEVPLSAWGEQQLTGVGEAQPRAEREVHPTPPGRGRTLEGTLLRRPITAREINVAGRTLHSPSRNVSCPPSARARAAAWWSTLVAFQDHLAQ
jgi:hypothetical protein